MHFLHFVLLLCACEGLAPYFLLLSQTEQLLLMDLFIIILSFLLAYGIFVLIAVKLAKMFFPQIHDDEVELKTGALRERQRKRITV